MARKFAYLTMAVIILLYIDQKVNVRCCKCGVWSNHPTVSAVTAGLFSETIPQTGNVTEDHQLHVPIDELYLPRIKVGLPATVSFNNVDIRFQITHIDSTVTNGRFAVLMNLTDTAVDLTGGQSLRLRIQLSEPHEAIRIPVGGFYKDTGGTWIYVMKDENHFVKRNIRLGPKNPEYFTVVEGLTPGEKVITSSYENFFHKDEVSRWEIERKKPVSMM